MFVGVFIHSTAVYAPWQTGRTSNEDRYVFFDWINMSLNLFAASPVFMIVGGFFTLFLLRRYSIPEFFSKRILRLSAPLVATGVTFGLVETYLRYQTRTGADALSFGNYITSSEFSSDLAAGLWLHQTWFLVVLIICVFLAGVVYHFGKRLQLTKGLPFLLDYLVAILEKFPVPWFCLIVGLTGFQLMVMKVTVLIIPDPYSPLTIGPVGLVSPYLIANFSALFVFGMMLLSSPRLFDLTFRWSWPLMITACAAFAFGAAVHPDNIRGTSDFDNVLLAIYMMCRWVTSIMFLQLMHRFFSDRPRPIMILLTDAAMTVYMVHHCITYVVGEMLTAVAWPAAIEVMVVFSISTAFAIAFHYTVVAQSSVFRLLFNGQTKGPALGIRDFYKSYRI